MGEQSSGLVLSCTFRAPGWSSSMTVLSRQWATLSKMGTRINPSADVLVEMGELEKEEVTLFTIRDWLRANPDRLDEVSIEEPELCLFQTDRRRGKRAERRPQRRADTSAQYCGRSQCDSTRCTRMVADHICRTKHNHH